MRVFLDTLLLKWTQALTVLVFCFEVELHLGQSSLPLIQTHQPLARLSCFPLFKLELLCLVRHLYFKFVFFFNVPDVSLNLVEMRGKRLDQLCRSRAPSEYWTIVRGHQHSKMVLGMDAQMVAAVDIELHSLHALVFSAVSTQVKEFEFVGACLA